MPFVALITCIILFVLMAETNARACDTGTVRDSAFYGARDNYWLGMVFEESDIESRERHDRLAAWLVEHGASLNIQIEHILPDDAMYLRLRYGVAAPPEELPITYLAGRHPAESRPIVFMEWMPAPELTVLEELKTNPLFVRIARDTPEYWGCVLYVRGDGKRHGEIEAVAAQWRRTYTPGISVIEIDRNAPENGFFCALAGIEKEGEDWTGVVFGKGKLMMPVLVGDAITARELDRLLNRLMIPCTCVEQATVFALDIPMFWDAEHSERHIELAAPLGYMEMTLDDKFASIFTELPSGARTVNTVALAVLTVLGIVAVFALSVAYLRLRSR